MISLRCEWCQPTACIILQLEDLRKDDSNLRQALCMSSSHSIAMLQNQHDLKWKGDQFMPKPLLKSIWLHENVGTVAIDGWWWVTIQWEVQRTIYSSRVTGSFQQTSPLLRHLPGILEGGKKKRENNKRSRQSRARQAAPDSAFKGICFDFIKLFSWSLQKRNTLCQEKEDPTGKATSEW